MLTKCVATKVTPETYEEILAIAYRNEVTVSPFVRQLLMRALGEIEGNLKGNDSSGERSR